MKKTLFVSLLFISALLALPAATRPAHAQLVGVVCIDPAIAQTVAATGCSPAPVTVGGTQFTVGSKFTLEVDLSGSDIMNGFEVAVMTDPTVLNPVSTNASGTATLINTIGGSTLPLVNCINDVGTSCVLGIDGVGVAHLSIVALGAISNAPTTGRLMYINYQVMGLSSGSPISYVVTTPTGAGACAGSSNSTTAGDACVFIANGGGGFDPENVQTATFANQLDTTATAVACSPSTIFVGGTSTCTATVSDTTAPANTPTGSVSFTSSNTAIGTVGASCGLNSTGSCSVAFTGMALGTATVSGTYGGDSTHNGSSGTSNPITISQGFSATSVGCSPSTIDIGAMSTCTANVTDTSNPANTPTGTVSFTSSNTAVGTVGASCNLVSGSCSVAFTGVATGTATVTGTYGGDSTHNGSSGTSNPISVVAPPKDTTSTSVTCPSTVVAGQSITCTANVIDLNVTSNIPTGSVSFTSSNTGVGTVGASCALSGGSCTVTFTGVAPGNATVTGTYGGDTAHFGSSGTSGLISVTPLQKDTTSTSVTCPSTVVAGQSITCTATVTDTTNAANTPTGTVNFTSSNTSVGTVGASCTLSGGSCTVSFTGVTLGNATVTGTYGGDGTHDGSSGTSGPIIVTIPPPLFVHGKLSWTHHLSLSKASGVQTFTAHVEDMATVPVFVQVVVTGVSDNGQPFSAMSAIIMLQPGVVTDITFTGSVPPGSVGFKISFTATLPWGSTSALGQPSASSKSGSFAVVA